MSNKHFLQAQARMNVIRYEEADRLFKELYDLEKQVKETWGDDDFRHKYTDRPLTHTEVYCRALDDVMNMLDERLGVLSAP